MTYISWSSDFMLHLEDNLMYYYHILGLCDLYFIALRFLYPLHTKYVGVYSFRFSVSSFVRWFVHLSVTGSKFLR